MRSTLVLFTSALRAGPRAVLAAATLLPFACGGEQDTESGKAGLTLPTATDSEGWRFGQDSADAANADTGTAQDDIAPGDDAEDGAATADGGGGDDDGDAGSGAADASDDAGAAITSCKGHCGLFLEGNACRCHHGCLGSEASCCGGDGAYLAVCACQGDADCDDNNPCTTDSCQAKGGQSLCMNLPFAGCCTSDAACKGGDGVCTFAKCLDGVCTVAAKPCDDGVSCTIDTCNPADGACQNILSASSCAIDGACWKAGEAKPGSGGCQRCKPDVDPKAWSPMPNTCFIDGACVEGGVKASDSADECRTCIPAKSASAWTPSAGSCLIAGVCYASGATGSGGCEVCDPAANPAGWSGKTGTCAIDGVCYDAGKGPGTCAICDPATSTSALTVTGGCFIDGACFAEGAAKPGSGGCERCEAAKSKVAWTATLGKPCDDGDSCTENDACTSVAGCKGKPKTSVCCKSDAECATQVQPAACEKAVCKGDGSCAVAPKTNCCSAGVCCDLGLGEFKSKGTLCQSIDSKKVEYKCEDNKAFKRYYGYGCTGEHASKCSSEITGYSAWEAMSSVVCGAGKTCTVPVNGSPVCK